MISGASKANNFSPKSNNGAEHGGDFNLANRALTPEIPLDWDAIVAFVVKRALPPTNNEAGAPCVMP